MNERIAIFHSELGLRYFFYIMVAHHTPSTSNMQAFSLDPDVYYWRNALFNFEADSER